MARIIITLSGKGIRQAGVDALVQKLKTQYGEGVSLSVQKKEPAESRSERFQESKGHVEDAKGTAEELREELEGWKDRMPENLQSASKAEEIDEAISQLEEFIEKCEELADHDVSFPAMR